MSQLRRQVGDGDTFAQCGWKCGIPAVLQAALVKSPLVDLPARPLFRGLCQSRRRLAAAPTLRSPPAQLGGRWPAQPFVDPDRGRGPVAERRVRRSSPAKGSSRYATSLRSRSLFIRRSRSAATSATASCQRPPASRCPRRAPVLASRRTRRVETPRATAASAVPRNGEDSRADIEGAPFVDLEKPSWLDDRTSEPTSEPRRVPEAEPEPDSCSSCQVVPTWTSAATAFSTSFAALGWDSRPHKQPLEPAGVAAQEATEKEC